MQDKETGSLWSHILGEAKRGPLKGTTLEVIPASLTTWRRWRAAHPKTTVATIPRVTRRFTAGFYRRRPDGFVLGLVHDGKAYAWSFGKLMAAPVVNADLDGEPAVVMFDAEDFTGQVFSRRLGERVLTFSMKEKAVTDRDTGSTWDVVAGRATAGPLKGKTLKPLPAIESFKDRWRAFHPDTSMN